MEHYSLSPVAMFMNAGLVAKLVMATLLLASIWTWVLIIEGNLRLVVRVSKSARAARAGEPVGLLTPILAVGKHAIEVHLPRRDDWREARARRRGHGSHGREFLIYAEGGVPDLLAIIASVAPFIGLFGTVWGIMTSFAGIAQSNSKHRHRRPRHR